MRSLLALATVCALFAAGCVAPSALTPNSATVDATAITAKLTGLLKGVPCDAKTMDPAKTSENLKPLAQIEYDPATHGEIDIKGDWLLSARYQQGGFEVANVADPTMPLKMGVYQSTEKTAYDVKWMPDNKTAVVGHGRTIELVDVTPVMRAGLTPETIDKQAIAPTLISEWRYPDPSAGHMDTNMHMLTTARIAGVDWVFVAPNDDTGVALLKLEGAGAERHLTLVRHIGDDQPSGGALGPHDMSVVWDQILNKPVLYVANGFEGWRAFDITDPAKPVPLGTMVNVGTAQGYTHTVIGQKIGSKRLVATIQEVGSNTLTIFDATDFSKPVPIAQWQSDRTDPTTPQHNIQLLDGKLYVAHYTKGMYVFDLAKMDTSPTGFLMLQPVAHFEPAKPASNQVSAVNFANVWDVYVHEGLVYVNDVKAGVSVLGYGCLQPGNVAQTSVN